MHFNTTNLIEARAVLADTGGWLLDMGDGHYLVTDDPGIVKDMRGPDFIPTCEARQAWDETGP